MQLVFHLFSNLLLLAYIGCWTTAAPFPIVHTTSLDCRSSPTTSAKIVKTYTASVDLRISCQGHGESVNGNDLWDKTQDNCFVADFFVKTGTTKAVAPLCPGSVKLPSTSTKPSSSTSSKVPGPRLDDYKFKGKCSGADSFRFFKCQCTSFVAQRINERLGIKFTNSFKGAHWGNANSWDEAARQAGFKVDGTPKPGAIAQSNRAPAGHVAWVSEVTKDGKVVVEEYNFNNPEAYGTRTLPKSSFNYIHLQ